MKKKMKNTIRASILLLVTVVDACYLPIPSVAPAMRAVPVSCIGPDGQSRCGFVSGRWNRTPANLANSDTKLGAASGGDRMPVIPPAWTVPAWYFDPANVTSCASDNNNCTQGTCGSVGSFQGPCSTYGEIAARLGTYSPRLRQVTTFTCMSNDGESDPFYLSPYLENGAYVVVQGVPTVVASGVFGTVTAKNQSTPQLLNVSLPGSIAVGQMIIDTTHPSEAWVYTNVSGATWALSQPLAPGLSTVIGQPFGNLAPEVNWTNGGNAGDAFTANTFPTLYVASLQPIQEQWSTGVVGGVFLYQVTNANNASRASPFIMGSPVAMVDVLCQRQPTGTPSGSSQLSVSSFYAYSQEIYNSYIQGGVSSLGLIASRVDVTNEGSLLFAGGVISTTVNTPSKLGYVSLQQDTILGVTAHGGFEMLGGSLSGTYIETGSTVTVNANQVDIIADLNGANALIWGPGSIEANANARLKYAPGAGGAAASLLLKGTIKINGQSQACIAQTTASTIGACNTAISVTTLDANLGTIPGCLTTLGSGAICNFGL